MVQVYGQRRLRLDFSNHFLNNMLGKFDLERRQIDLNFVDRAHDGPETAVLDAGNGFYHPQVFTRVHVLRDLGV